MRAKGQGPGDGSGSGGQAACHPVQGRVKGDDAGQLDAASRDCQAERRLQPHQVRNDPNARLENGTVAQQRTERRRRRLVPEGAQPQQERAPCAPAAELQQRGRLPLDPLGVEAEHRGEQARADGVQPLCARGLGGGGGDDDARRGGGEAAPAQLEGSQHREGERGGRSSSLASAELHRVRQTEPSPSARKLAKAPCW